MRSFTDENDSPRETVLVVVDKTLKNKDNTMLQQMNLSPLAAKNAAAACSTTARRMHSGGGSNPRAATRGDSSSSNGGARSSAGVHRQPPPPSSRRHPQRQQQSGQIYSVTTNTTTTRQKGEGNDDRHGQIRPLSDQHNRSTRRSSTTARNRSRRRPLYDNRMYRAVARALNRLRQKGCCRFRRRAAETGPQNLQKTLLNGRQSNSRQQQGIWTSNDSSSTSSITDPQQMQPAKTISSAAEKNCAKSNGVSNDSENGKKKSRTTPSCCTGCFRINSIRSILARLLFVLHALIAVWRAWLEWDKRGVVWLLMIPVSVGVLEGVIRSRTNDGNESRWFSMSVFCYLCSMIPTIWALQLALTNAYRSGTLTCGADLDNLNTLVNLTAGKTNAEVRAIANFTSAIGIQLPTGLTVAINNLHPSIWLTLMEQSLLVILIIGRWLMPSAFITADIMSQLLLVWLAIGADIADLFDTVVKNCDIFKSNMSYVYLVLIIWSVSLLQFPVQLTGKGRKIRTVAVRKMTIEAPNQVKVEEQEVSQGKTSFCLEMFTNLEFWSIMFTTSLQDGPFLGLRLYFLTRSTLSSYTMVFFTCKNSLVVLLQMYRLYGITAKIREDTKDRTQLLEAQSDPSSTITTVLNQSNQPSIPIPIPLPIVAPNHQSSRRKSKSKSPKYGGRRIGDSSSGLNRLPTIPQHRLTATADEGDRR